MYDAFYSFTVGLDPVLGNQNTPTLRHGANKSLTKQRSVLKHAGTVTLEGFSFRDDTNWPFYFLKWLMSLATRLNQLELINVNVLPVTLKPVF